MSKDTQNTNRKIFISRKRKQFTAKKTCRLTQKLQTDGGFTDNHKRHDTGSTADFTSRSLELTNFPRCHGSLKRKSAKVQRGNARKPNSSLQKKHVVSVGRATVPITPQMIRVAVKELQTRRAFISSGLIASHLRRCYPIENDPDALKKELFEKLNCAVSVGLIAKCGDDKYCIPTLRQQATLNKTALTSFWDTYYRSGATSNMERLYTLRIPKVRAYKKSASIVPKCSNEY